MTCVIFPQIQYETITNIKTLKVHMIGTNNKPSIHVHVGKIHIPVSFFYFLNEFVCGELTFDHHDQLFDYILTTVHI